MGRRTPIDKLGDLLIAHARPFRGSERGFLALPPGIDVMCICGVAGDSNGRQWFRLAG